MFQAGCANVGSQNSEALRTRSAYTKRIAQIKLPVQTSHDTGPFITGC